jgi:pimeloyl-ACP methyl ester carboxylesterase
MRWALLVSLVAALGCGGKAHPTSDSDDDGPFVAKGGFEPTAFRVAVHGHGRPVIFIPGLACPGEMWDDTVERLGDDVEAHVLTLAGFAGTTPIKPPLAAKTRKELIRYIRSHKLDHPIVVGHSMGGFIAYWLAATTKDLLGGIVVVDAGPALDADDDEAKRLRNVWAQAGDDEIESQIRGVYSWMARDPSRLEAFFPAIAKSDRQTIGDAIFEMVKTDISDKVSAIDVPLLLVLADGGLQGRYRAQAKSVPEHEVVVLPKTRHFVMVDDPEGFARTVRKFLAAHE